MTIFSPLLYHDGTITSPGQGWAWLMMVPIYSLFNWEICPLMSTSWHVATIIPQDGPGAVWLCDPTHNFVEIRGDLAAAEAR